MDDPEFDVEEGGPLLTDVDRSSLISSSSRISSKAGEGKTMKPGGIMGRVSSSRLFAQCPSWITLNRNLRCLAVFILLIGFYIVFQSVSSSNYSWSEYTNTNGLNAAGEKPEVLVLLKDVGQPQGSLGRHEGPSPSSAVFVGLKERNFNPYGVSLPGFPSVSCWGSGGFIY
jgi:hypothetical protein